MTFGSRLMRGSGICVPPMSTETRDHITNPDPSPHPSRHPGSRWPPRRARPNPARLAGGLTCLTVANARFSRSSSSRSVPPWNTLQTKAPPGDEHLAGELGRRLGQPHDAQMVGARCGPCPARPCRRARRRRGPRAAAPAAAPARVVVHEIELQELDAGDRLHRQEVDGDHLAPLPSTDAHPLGRHLGPAARRGAEVDHALAGLEQAVLVVDLDQLEGGARAVALALGGGHVGIVELALEPALRGGRALLGGLQPHLELPPPAGPPLPLRLLALVIAAALYRRQ